MRLTTYEEHTTATSCELEMLKHENAILHSGARPPLELDRELQVAYPQLSEAEHGCNHTRQLLDITREEVDVCTYRIIHLEHAIEAQDAELEERAETITNLEHAIEAQDVELEERAEMITNLEQQILQFKALLLVLFKAFACLVVTFWSHWICLAERSRSSFALVVFYVQLRNCFLFPVMPSRVVSGMSKPMRVGLRTSFLRLRVLVDDILY
jgi:uncharacterized protein YueI